jgi:hypothetical protein
MLTSNARRVANRRFASTSVGCPRLEKEKTLFDATSGSAFPKTRSRVFFFSDNLRDKRAPPRRRARHPSPRVPLT